MMKALILFVLVCLTCLEGCVGLQIPNIPIYRDKGKLGAIKSYTRGEEERQTIPLLEWNKIRFGMFCMDPQGLGDYRKFIEMACQRDKNCIDGVRRVLDNVDEQAARSIFGDVDKIPTATQDEIDNYNRTGHLHPKEGFR
jgi:hypothetical protein